MAGGYRQDSRAPCVVCNRPIHDDDVLLDDQGRATCKACANLEGSAKADRTIAIERGKKMTRIGIGIAIGVFLAGVVGIRAWGKHKERSEQRAIQGLQTDCRVRMDSLAERTAEFLDGHAPSTVDKACDDVALGAITKPDGQDFLVYEPNTVRHWTYPGSDDARTVIESAEWPFAYASDVPDKRAALERFERRGAVVVFAPVKDADAIDERAPVEGFVIVMDVLGPNGARCWARVHLQENPRREDYAAALAKITKRIDLRR